MNPNMSFEQAPSLDVPLRFFITAALFGISAGLLFTFQGAGLLSRWSATSLALTHLLTGGLMLQIMIGALLQLTPVAIGITIWRPRIVAAWVHLLATSGTIILTLAFLYGGKLLYAGAGILIVLATLPFTLLLLIRLLRAQATGDMLNAMRIAGVMLVFTVLLGAILAASRGGLMDTGWLAWSSLHIRLGWLGWGLLLLAGVSYQVVPMFQLTPPYPALFRKLFLPAILFMLLIAALAIKYPRAGNLVILLESTAAILFAVTTLNMQRQRRRKRSDGSFHFWRIALYSMLLAATLQLSRLCFPHPPAAEVSFGILVLAGVFASVMIGMLYKIIPFLIWLHLQRRGIKPLLMNQVISEQEIKHHLYVHLPALLLCIITPWWTNLAPLAGALFTLGCTLLLLNMLRALKRFNLALQNHQAPPATTTTTQSPY